MTTLGKYFDGKTAKSQSVELIINGPYLVLLDNEDSKNEIARWLISDIKLDEAFPSHAVLFSRMDPEARLEVNNLKQLKALRLKQPRIWGARLGWELLLLLIALPLAAWALVTTSSASAVWLAKRIPIQWERKLLGTSPIPICVTTPEQRVALDKLLRSVYPLQSDENPIPILIGVADEAEANAFAFPGGRIVLLRGLVREAESAAELAGVIAHEIEHIQARHILAGLLRAATLSLVGIWLSGDASGILAVTPELMLKLTSLRFSREMELEADAGALKRLQEARLEKNGLVIFLERMAKKSASRNSYLSTHPNWQERIQRIQAGGRAAENSQPLSELEFKQIKSICSP